ncbi:MAG: type IVB secretion system protein IcmH/DotU [Aliivibrio sp.]|uniref:type IVB secretion system protein IcmH/DotU n=1 Tax=Aliivibrio sp. TaxID=1872443 RepID=UPI001A54EF07|nr:type IVB secretion system protein IcmH/DotU [Aliivibrio sp.]
MTKTSYMDDRTVLVTQQPNETSPSLTAKTNAPRFEQLQERMVYAARLKSEEQSFVGINPLVDAAAPILGLAAELKLETFQDIDLLKARLIDEIKTFEFQALNFGVENNYISLSRYLLCTFVDEAVVTTPWGHNSSWSQQSMLSTFHNETYGGEKFFLLLEKLSRNPAKFLNLLELIYLCLSLGFEGKYRVLSRGLIELDTIRDSLYRQIRSLRGDEPKGLSPNWEPKRVQRHKLTRNTSRLGICFVVILCLTAMFSGFYYVLDQQSTQVTDSYLQITQ